MSASGQVRPWGGEGLGGGEGAGTAVPGVWPCLT